MAIFKTPTAAAYRLEAEYWHPDVTPAEAFKMPASGVPLGSALIENAFDRCDDEQDVRCWYYLLLAAEVAA